MPLKPLVIDLETYYDSEYSLSKMTTESYIRDERFKVHGAGVKVGTGPAIWVTGYKLPALFARIPWHEVCLIGHNLQFDGSILAWIYGCIPALYIDTLGMSRALVGQYSARHGLHYVSPLVAKHNGHPLHKMDGLAQAKGIRELPAWNEKILADYTVKPPHFNPKTGQWEAGDAVLTWELLRSFAPIFPKHEYQRLDWTIRKFTQPTLWLDDDLLLSYEAEVKANKELALKRAGLDSRETLMSNPKYAAALEALGVRPPVKINKNGKIAFAFAKTDAEHKALLEHDNPDVQALVAARLAVKTTIEETRARSYYEASGRGQWPVAYSYSGAVNTHRLSGNKGGGGNPMNLKRGGTLRDCIMAPQGYTILVFDLAQIECRMTLWYGALSSRSKGMEREALELMASGGDLYSHFASMMFGRPIDKKNDPNERQIGKSAVLGLGFGMGPARFMDYSLTMGAKGVDAMLAEATVALYRNTYTGVRAMWRTLEQALKDGVQQREKMLSGRMLGKIHTFDGWKIGPTRVVLDPLFESVSFQTGENELLIKYPELMWDAEGECTYRDGNGRANMFGGKAMENVIQNGAKTVLDDKKMEIQERYEVAMSTYDEVAILVPATEHGIMDAIDFCKPIMERQHPLFPGLPINVDYGYAPRYGKAKS